MLKTVLLYNKKKEITQYQKKPEDFYAEFDSDETILAIKKALTNSGSKVKLIEADEHTYEKIKNSKIDIVFNVAEGLYGESRESHIPAILEMLNIPYTGSGVLTLALTLNKAKTKEVLTAYKIPTPNFQVIKSTDEKINNKLRFPLIIKPLAEGSSKGIRNNSLVRNMQELNEKVKFVIKNYDQPALIEEYLDGREFTVAVIGNGKPITLPIVEIKFDDLPKEANKIYSYDAKWIWDKPEKPLNIFKCPAQIPKELEEEIKNAAINAYKATNCREWARIDIRLDKDNIPNVLEINPLPGILPNPEENSCFPKAARAAGFTYEELVNIPLYFALKRYGIKHNNKKFKELENKLNLLNNECSGVIHVF